MSSQHLFQKADGIIDLREFSEFKLGHLADSTSLPWEVLPESLNQLCAAPAEFFLVGDKQHIEAASILLDSKGYSVNGSLVIDAKTLSFWKASLAEFWQEGTHSKSLWQPSPVVKEWVQGFLKEAQSQKDGRLNALDLGCGGGRDAVFLAKNRINVVAIDQEARVLKRAKQLAAAEKASVKFKCCNLSQENCIPEEQKFDLILGVRFLNREILPTLKDKLNRNGFLVWQTFCGDFSKFESPKSEKAILNQHELAEVFASLKIIVDRIDLLPDGRPVNTFIAQMID